MTVWFDTHCHIQEDDYNEDRHEVLRRAFDAGVRYITLATSNVADSEAAVELASRYRGVYASVGVHPHDAESWDDSSADRLKRLLEVKHADGSPVVVGVGEIGLDYYYDNSPREIQKTVYRRQLELAAEWELPVIIHERDAFADSYAILRQAAEDDLLRPVAGVCHCFSGSPESARLLTALGFYIGVDGPLTFKNARKAPEVVDSIIRERLVVETDSPFLTPVPFRGKRNEPARVVLVGQKVAEIWQTDEAEAARQTTENALRLYHIDPEHMLDEADFNDK